MQRANAIARPVHEAHKAMSLPQQLRNVSLLATEKYHSLHSLTQLELCHLGGPEILQVLWCIHGSRVTAKPKKKWKKTVVRTAFSSQN